MFNAAKDALASRAAQAWANNLIGRYGKIQGLKIDSRLKTLEVSCLLEGETSPVNVRVENYVLESEGDSTFIRGTQFTSSRPWLQRFLSDFGPGKRVRLPPWAVGAL